MTDDSLEMRPGMKLATELGQQPVPDSILDDAEYWETHHLAVYRAAARVREWCQDHGPVRLPQGGVVGFFASGVAWDAAAVHVVAPQLISLVKAQVVGTEAQVERALSLVLEEVPEIQVGDIAYTIDRDALNGVMRTPGALRDALEGCREQKSRLEAR
jgi:hypothetical protein